MYFFTAAAIEFAGPAGFPRSFPALNNILSTMSFGLGAGWYMLEAVIPISQAARVALAMAGVLLAGCEGTEPAPAAPSGSFVRIASITPDTSGPLQVGDRVVLRVVVDYNLTSDAGTLSLVVQAADNSNLASTVEVLRKGRGKIILVAQFVVPDSNGVQIFTPLSAQGQHATSTVDHRAYTTTSARLIQI